MSYIREIAYLSARAKAEHEMARKTPSRAAAHTHRVMATEYQMRADEAERRMLGIVLA